MTRLSFFPNGPLRPQNKPKHDDTTNLVNVNQGHSNIPSTKLLRTNNSSMGGANKKKNSNRKQGKQTNDDTNGKHDESADDEEETLKDVFLGHPLVRVILFALPLLIPLGLYRGYVHVVLQHPEWIDQMVASIKVPPWLASTCIPFYRPLTPPTTVTSPRQVLILGCMSSGTTQVAHDLYQHFGLEIGHEDTDALSRFVRDGVSVSWYPQ